MIDNPAAYFDAAFSFVLVLTLMGFILAIMIIVRRL